MNHQSKPDLHRFCILHCEDDPGHAFLIRKLLERHSPRIQIVLVSDGLRGMEYLKNNQEKLPHLILLDLNMPRMGGIEMLRQIKSHALYQHIPVVVLTTSSADSDQLNATNYSADCYLVKPMEYQDLHSQIQDIYQRWIEPISELA